MAPASSAKALPAEPDPALCPSMDIPIIAETESFVCIYKQAGIPFHRVKNQPGILELLRQTGRFSDRLYPVHRLDQLTSGLILFGRGRRATNELGNHFRFGRIKKIYLALSNRPPHKKQGRLQGDMEKGRNGAWILKRSQTNPARTIFFSESLAEQRKGLRLYVLRPLTGRTHQIRVALKSLGAPILGDGLYGRFDLARQEERAYLHAWHLSFQLFEKNYSFQALPREGAEFLHPVFKKAIKKLGQGCAVTFPGEQKRTNLAQSKNEN